MNTDRTSALLKRTADEIRADIVEYEAMLARIPRRSDNPNDGVVLNIFTDLLRERRAMLARLQVFELF